MTEKQFQSQIIATAKQAGWLCYHTYDSRRSDPGFPDLVLVKYTVIYRELKTDIGKLTDAQRRWGERLLNAGANWGVWRPHQIKDIVKMLHT